MFDEILNAVKEQFGNHPELSTLPTDQQEAIHKEIANHVQNNLQSQPGTTQSDETKLGSPQSESGGLLSKLEGALTSNSPVTGAVVGGLVSSLGSKFGLPPSITGAISGALPGLIQKFTQKTA